MTQLHKYHDVTPFCADHPLPSGAPQNHVKYDAKTQTLVASDGKIAIVVPVGGACDAPDGLIPQGRLATAAEKQHTLAALDGKLALNKKEVTPNGNADVGQFGHVFGVLQGQDPDVVIPLSLDTLEPLVAYSKQHGTGGLFLCVNHASGKNWQDRRITGAIQFLFDVQTDDTDAAAVQAVGVLMPCLVENVQAVHSRVRAAIALANAGKSDKEKAAAARKRAAERKAACTDDPAQDAGTSKPQGQARQKASSATEAATAASSGNPRVPVRLKVVGANGSDQAAKHSQPPVAPASRIGQTPELADLLTRAQASLSRHKFAAARRFLNSARAEIEAGQGHADLLAEVDKLDLRISKEKAAFKKG
jgi:hypothetical protein